MFLRVQSVATFAFGREYNLKCFKMMAETCVLFDHSHSLSLNADTNSAVKCVSCLQKQRQLDDILSQLKSLKKIVEILQQDSSLEYGRDFCCQVTDNWTSVPSKW
jgi:hypothetical protein